MRRVASEPARSHSTVYRSAAWVLIALLGVQMWGCAGNVRVIPFGTRITEVHPIRYYDLWNALEIGRGVLVGIGNGKSLTGEFVSGGARQITIRTGKGWHTIPVADIRYLVNVIDLSYARDGAIAGGVLGLGAGFSLGYLTAGTGGDASAKISRNSDDDYDYDESASESAAGESESQTSESSADTSPSGSSSEATESSVSDAAETGSEASSSESSSGDATNPGSTAAEGSSADESGGSSVGNDGNATTQNSTQSSEESAIVVNVYSESSGSAAGGAEDDPSQPSTSSARAWRTFFYTTSFAALGAFAGWAIGRSIRKRTPRVDYVIFPEVTRHEGITGEEHLVREMAVRAALPLNEMIPPGSQFDSPRSAALYSRHSVASQAVELFPGMGPLIKDHQAAEYRLFPAVDRFQQAVILRVGEEEETRTGLESRYLALVVTERRSTPTVQLQRLSASDVVRMSTQVRLIHGGVVE